MKSLTIIGITLLAFLGSIWLMANMAGSGTHIEWGIPSEEAVQADGETCIEYYVDE